MIAMSATLKMPVRSGPTPMLRKSITLPRTRRSTQFDAPPARTRLVPIKSHPRHRKRTAAPNNVRSMTPVPSVNRAVRAEEGKLAPRLRNPPAFSTYSSRIVSAKYDRAGSLANEALATCLVTRSQPIVATTAISSTARTPILVIIFKSSAKSPRQNARLAGPVLKSRGISRPTTHGSQHNANYPRRERQPEGAPPRSRPGERLPLVACGCRVSPRNSYPPQRQHQGHARRSNCSQVSA